MPPPKAKGILYDIRPVNNAGQVDFKKISQIKPELNLKKEDRSKSSAGKEVVSESFDEEMAKDQNVESVLAEVGAMVLPPGPLKHPLRRGLIARPVLTAEEPARAPEISTAELMPSGPAHFGSSRSTLRQTDLSGEWHSPVSREVEARLKSPPPFIPTEPPSLGPAARSVVRGALWFYAVWIGMAVLLVLTAVKIADRSGEIKEDFIERSRQGADSLKEARTDIANFDFASAANNFTLAYDNFSQASSRLDWLGSALTSFLGKVPGLARVQVAKNVLKAGESISKAGETLALSLDNLYRTNFVSYFGFDFLETRGQSVSTSHFISLFKDAALFAQKRLGVAYELLAQIDPGAIPEEKRNEFLDLKAQIPAMEEYMGRVVNYSNFLLEALGKSKPRKYLLLFQNNTELRPTGGFPGSYALIGLNRGFLREFQVDDIYNIDGQARKNIVPPRELQHITSTWGMRDANWFINFPDSAKKVMQMYTENNGGPEVDGVITVTPTLIVKILEVLGPIALPQYNLVLDHNNFLAAIQDEVEYGENRQQPKQVLVDFTPKFIEKLGQQDREQWFKVVAILLEGVQQKHILAYFRDPEQQKVAEENNFAGVVKQTKDDYLLVTHSNVKGAKTDAVIDNRYQLATALDQNGFVEHALTITRTHRGGKTPYGFYNRTSYDYLRVLVPRGSVLTAISGHSRANFIPLVKNYSGTDYEEDVDLQKYESQATIPMGGVRQFEEAGKTVFGFWLFLSPGETKSVTVKYKTLAKLDEGEYLLMVQKQPGTFSDAFQFSFSLPENKTVVFRYPALQIENRQASFQTELTKDLIFGIKMQ